MGRTVKCAYCGALVDKDTATRYKDKNFHCNCAQLQKDKDALTEYICQVYKLKAPGPRNYAMIKKYLNEGYTYEGMLLSLKYFYEIKKNPTDQANSSIGIIPWIYEEAVSYYKNVIANKKKLKKGIEKQMNEPKETISISVTPIVNTRNRKMYDLNELFEG